MATLATLERAWCGCWMVVKMVVGGATAGIDEGQKLSFVFDRSIFHEPF